MTKTIFKKLSPNDVGTTGAHQAGIVIPKDKSILEFFPALNGGVKNPRAQLQFFETDGTSSWPFVFIYYNGKLFGGTRNEYRLTGMTGYLRSVDAKEGDSLELNIDGAGTRRIRLIRANSKEEMEIDSTMPLKLAGSWKVIKIK